jgi:hypothetical protein
MQGEIMYYYQVGYGSYEESDIHTLKHEKQFTQEQFDELVSDCVVKVYHSQPDDYMRKQLMWLNDKVIELLVSEYGFQKPVFQASFIAFGWADLDDPDDWKPTVEDAQLDLIRAKIRSR